MLGTPLLMMVCVLEHPSQVFDPKLDVPSDLCTIVLFVAFVNAKHTLEYPDPVLYGEVLNKTEHQGR